LFCVTSTANELLAAAKAAFAVLNAAVTAGLEAAAELI
jgi:hypothetical protein